MKTEQPTTAAMPGPENVFGDPTKHQIPRAAHVIQATIIVGTPHWHCHEGSCTSQPIATAFSHKRHRTIYPYSGCRVTSAGAHRPRRSPSNTRPTLPPSPAPPAVRHPPLAASSHLFRSSERTPSPGRTPPAAAERTTSTRADLRTGLRSHDHHDAHGNPRIEIVAGTHGYRHRRARVCLTAARPMSRGLLYASPSPPWGTVPSYPRNFLRDLKSRVVDLLFRGRTVRQDSG